MRHWVLAGATGQALTAAALGAYFLGVHRSVAGIGFVLAGVAAGLLAVVVYQKEVRRGDEDTPGDDATDTTTQSTERCEDLVG